jgi:hypothetical protein
VGGNLWSDYQGRDEMQGPGQNVPGKDGFGDTPYKISESAKDEYPVMGNQVKQISLESQDLTPTNVRVGDSITVKAKLKSRYELSQVTAHAFQSGKEAEGYSRLVKSGDSYLGSFSTALLDPGNYDIVLSATDARGFELRETLGTVSVTSRGGFS